MTGLDVYAEICEEATALRYQGQPPAVVQLGHAQVAALETLDAIGRLGDTLRVQVSQRPGAGFRARGGAFESSAAEFIELHVERLNEPDALRVLAGEPNR